MTVLQLFVQKEIIAIEQMRETEEIITSLIRERVERDVMFVDVHMISVFCVNKNSKILNELMHTELMQGPKNGRLNVSIPLDDDYIYIARQESGMGISKYRKLHARFMSLIVNFCFNR